MILPDVLEKGLRIVFCGTAVGDRSAKRRCYYAGRGNKF
ncbi:MAG: mismatch-specific DNA-glycosylase, partial [Candidatus Parcubacteria bacterium]|nr:mismatch-specific DNA-glycosylase [Candidatus Parcubacteria bacterium]